MATSPKTPQNKQHAAFPSLFKRTGEARRVKGYRASRETFNRAMRMGKALDNAPHLTVITPVGAIVLSAAATELLKEDGGVAALILNGFVVTITSDANTLNAVNDFLVERNMMKGEDLLTGNMFDEGEE